MLENHSSILPVNPDNRNYWKTFVSKFMKWIPSVSLINHSKEDKIANWVARRNRKTYDGKFDPMELEEWIKDREKIFIVLKVPKEKKVNIGSFYLTKEADIW